VRNVTDRVRNPFGMEPDCERAVPGYGDANADFHVVGDHPVVHGGLGTGIPFTGTDWAADFRAALAEAGLLRSATLADGEPAPLRVAATFLSYLHMCEPAGATPSDAEYADMERFFDAELRAIAAHVVLPVGARATAHVLAEYTAQAWKTDVVMDELHATEIRGAGWLVVPVKEPAEWVDDDADRLVAALRELRETDYRRVSDLGRFIAGDDPYLVR